MQRHRDLAANENENENEKRKTKNENEKRKTKNEKRPVRGCGRAVEVDLGGLLFWLEVSVVDHDLTEAAERVF